VSLDIFELFQGKEFEPFKWNGGQPAALLIHGFPGTPAELRPLGLSLHNAGWTVHGLLLPGFGAQIDTLFERQASEWVTAIENTLIDLQRKHYPILLIGYSMGAALSLQVACTHRPSGLVLLAPFWQVASWWQRIMGFLLKPFIRRVHPFKRVDFSNPQTRRGLSNLIPNINLDDSNVQQILRELSVPVSMFEQIYRVGHAAHHLAPEAAVPTLVIQGVQDEVVSLDKTRRLLRRLAGPTHYIEVTAGHDLVDPNQPAWPQVEQAVLTFAHSQLQG